MKTKMTVDGTNCDVCGKAAVVVEFFQRGQKGDNVNQQQWVCGKCLTKALDMIAKAKTAQPTT